MGNNVATQWSAIYHMKSFGWALKESDAELFMMPGPRLYVDPPSIWFLNTDPYIEDSSEVMESFEILPRFLEEPCRRADTVMT